MMNCILRRRWRGRATGQNRTGTCRYSGEDTMRGLFTTRLMISSGALGLILAAPLHAQETAPPPAEEAETAETSEGIGDIIVTAQKREESLQKVPISVTAVDGSMIESLHASTLQGLNGVVTNIKLNNFSNTPNSAVISTRGIGVVEPDPYAGNTVLIVYDGVPQFF